MGIESVGALRRCMDALDLDSNDVRTHTVSATISNDRDPKFAGSIDVIFNSNWHDPAGPFVEFGDEIKGFGIRFTQFKPRWVDMSWEESAKHLTIANQDYSFTLDFSA